MGNKHGILTGAMIAAIAVTVAACSSGGSPGPVGGTTLTYWASNQGTSLDNDKAVLTPVLDKFAKETGIKVDLEVIGWNDLQTRIQTAVTSGTGPDVLNIGNTWAASLQATGAFLPFDSANMKAVGGAAKFVKPALDTGGVPGRDLTSVPLYGQVYGLYYNIQMFKDAGLQPPATWEEFVADAKKLTDPSKGIYGFGAPAGAAGDNAHLAFINAAQNGVGVFDAKGNPAFTSDGMIQGVKRYLDLMQTDKVLNPSDAAYDNTAKPAIDFAAKKVAMIMSQNSADSVIASAGMKPTEYAVVPYPAPAGGQKISSHVAGINISIFKNTKNKAAALKFVDFMTSAWAQGNLGKAYGNLPILKKCRAELSTEPERGQNIHGDLQHNGKAATSRSSRGPVRKHGR